MSETPTTERSPWLALVLSLFCTGLGQIYAGRIVRGLALFLAFLLFAPLVLIASRLGPSTPVLVSLLLALAAVLSVMFFSIEDAYRQASKVRQSYQPKEFNHPLLYVLFILVGVAYPVVSVVYLRAHAFEAFYIPTSSEAPNLLPGDHVLVNKQILQGKVPRRGDLVVFRPPQDRAQNWVKRVVGLPGDTVELRDNDVYVNGKKLERDRVPPASLSAIQDAITGEVYYETNAGRRYMVMISAAKDSPAAQKKKVPQGCCFVLGDNRNHSLDSRDFGCVALGDILGLVQYIYYPAETWARFGAYED
jgi:signal peptidase I